jgi:hypothetical protein
MKIPHSAPFYSRSSQKIPVRKSLTNPGLRFPVTCPLRSYADTIAPSDYCLDMCAGLTGDALVRCVRNCR